jgi:imidazolonepropionase-like amidohydrolase
MTSEQGVSEVLAMMRRIKEEHPELEVDFVDAFCEQGVYNVEQTRR